MSASRLRVHREGAVSALIPHDWVDSIGYHHWHQPGETDTGPMVHIQAHTQVLSDGGAGAYVWASGLPAAVLTPDGLDELAARCQSAARWLRTRYPQTLGASDAGVPTLDLDVAP